MERGLRGDKCPESWGKGRDESLCREAGSERLVNLITKSRGTAVVTEPGHGEENLRETGKEGGQDVVPGCA